MPDDGLDLTTSQTKLSGAMSSSAFDHGRFAPGAVVAERYRIIGLLGRGGMGEVYRADDLTLGQSVALKFLPETLDRDREKVERLLAEVRTARQVSHPNVCRVHDVGQVDGRRFISMEYIDGEDLSVLLRRIGRLPSDKAVEIARQLCGGLSASHERGVLHRDLKPANIMLDGRGRVRITDFGLATALLPDGKAKGEFAGTPAYMAPEQLDGKPVSVQTDIYALGLVLYEIFTGKRFHNVRNLDELRQRHAQDSSLDLSSTGDSLLEPAVGRVLERCLEADPGRRPKSCAQVAASLPGGDPLAAAIAAGETPSPQLVAAASVQGGLSPRVAVALGLAFLAFVAVLARWQWNPASVFRINRSTEVMAAQTRDLLAALGYPTAPVDTASGFRYRHPDWRDPAVVDTPRPWSRLAELRPAAVYFWYREQPSIMAGYEVGRLGLEALALPLRTVTGPSPYEPGLEPGSIYVERGPDGSLDTLHVRPVPETAAAGGSVDWTRLFSEARLDMNDFVEASPEGALALPGSRRMAWMRRPAEGLDAMRVEAGELGGRPVAFRVLSPRTPYELGASPYYLAIRTTNANIVLIVTVGLLLVGYLGAGFFMWRNVVLGRGDRRGAARLARVIALLVFGASLLSSSVAIDGRVFSVIQGAAAVALFAGAWCWAFYMAIEPFVRRQWPRLLVGWSRLMAGEWRDPQVGREVFIGALSATGTTVLVTAASWMSRTPGAEPPLNEQYYFRSLGGADLLTGGILQVLPWTMFVCLVMMVALLLARRVLRSDYAAIAVLAVLNVGTAPTDQWLVLAASLIGAVIGFVVALRVGFLAQVSSIAVWLIVTALPFAPSTPGFVGTLSWLPIAAVVIPSLFGLYTALAGQSIFGSEADHS